MGLTQHTAANNQDGGRATAVQNRFSEGEARCPLPKGKKEEGVQLFLAGAAPYLIKMG
jgi:hypothetical protein